MNINTATTVDLEIFAVKNFSPVAWVAKIKHTKHILSRYTYNVNRGQVAKIKHAKI